MDSELQDILDRGIDIREKYSGGEFQGVNWTWKGFLSKALEDYFKQKFAEGAGQ